MVDWFQIGITEIIIKFMINIGSYGFRTDKHNVITNFKK